MTEKQSELLRPIEVADRLKISVRQVYKLIGDGPGQLRATRIGNKTIRIYADSVDALIEQGDVINAVPS